MKNITVYLFLIFLIAACSKKETPIPENVLKQKEGFQTSDFWIATTLVTLGEKLAYLDRSGGSRVMFVFNFSNTLEKNISDYQAERLVIEPKKLFIQSKLLKSRLYDG